MSTHLKSSTTVRHEIEITDGVTTFGELLRVLHQLRDHSDPGSIPSDSTILTLDLPPAMDDFESVVLIMEVKEEA